LHTRDSMSTNIQYKILVGIFFCQIWQIRIGSLKYSLADYSECSMTKAFTKKILSSKILCQIQFAKKNLSKFCVVQYLQGQPLLTIPSTHSGNQLCTEKLI